jgi:hypothetical protein
MPKFDEHSGHTFRANVAGEDGFIVVVDRIAPSIDRTTLVIEEVIIERMQEFDESSGHAGRTDVAEGDGFIVVVDRITPSIDWTTLVAERVVIE